LDGNPGKQKVVFEGVLFVKEAFFSEDEGFQQQSRLSIAQPMKESM
jgi:hypothetical protein